MVKDMGRLRAAVFERSGIAIDEHDPLMAVLAVSAQQTEEIGSRLLARTGPLRIVAATAATALVFGLVGGIIGWRVGYGHLEEARAMESAAGRSKARRPHRVGRGEGRAAPGGAGRGDAARELHRATLLARPGRLLHTGEPARFAGRFQNQRQEVTSI
jgi:hypothetical protein